MEKELCHRCGGSGNDPEHDGPCTECWAVNSKAREYDVVGDGLYAKLCQLIDKRAQQLHRVPGAYTHQIALVAAEFVRREILTLQTAIRKHRDQRGDSRCWMDDEELYAVLPEGYTPHQTDVPLYRSGNEAADAGMKSIRRPGRAARSMIGKLSALRARRK